jgi:uncharacterized OB-fold protein
MTESAKPVPQPTPESQPFWDGCRRGELLYQRCPSCGRAQFYPRPACAGCGGETLEWRRSDGRGTVHAVTVVYRPPTAAFKLDVPYAVALVDLDEGFRMMANIIGADPEAIAIGDRVSVTFERRGDLALPQFSRATHPAAASPSPR